MIAFSACSDDDATSDSSSSVSSTIAASSTSAASISSVASSASAVDFISVSVNGATPLVFTNGIKIADSGNDYASGYYDAMGDVTILRASADTCSENEIWDWTTTGIRISFEGSATTNALIVDQCKINVGDTIYETLTTYAQVSITVTNYGAVNGKIAGTFTGEVAIDQTRGAKRTQRVPGKKPVNGSFCVTRLEDAQ